MQFHSDATLLKTTMKGGRQKTTGHSVHGRFYQRDNLTNWFCWLINLSINIWKDHQKQDWLHCIYRACNHMPKCELNPRNWQSRTRRGPAPSSYNSTPCPEESSPHCWQMVYPADSSHWLEPPAPRRKPLTCRELRALHLLAHVFSIVMLSSSTSAMSDLHGAALLQLPSDVYTCAVPFQRVGALLYWPEFANYARYFSFSPITFDWSHAVALLFIVEFSIPTHKTSNISHVHNM